MSDRVLAAIIRAARVESPWPSAEEAADRLSQPMHKLTKMNELPVEGLGPGSPGLTGSIGHERRGQQHAARGHGRSQLGRRESATARSPRSCRALLDER